MDLKAKSREISESLVKLKEELHQTKETIQQEMEKNLQELKDASSKGDRSENAAFTAATDLFGMLGMVESGEELQQKFVECGIKAFTFELQCLKKNKPIFYEELHAPAKDLLSRAIQSSTQEETTTICLHMLLTSSSQSRSLFQSVSSGRLAQMVSL